MTARNRHERPDADWPHRIPFARWWAIVKRAVRDIAEDRVLLVSGGATFYVLLAVFPALTAFVSIYGLVADPKEISQHIAFITNLMPGHSFDIVAAQLQSLVTTSSKALGFGFVFGLLIALWSANSGIKTLFEAMNIAYEVREERGIIHLNLFSLFFTLGAMVIATMLIIAVGVIPALLALLPFPDTTGLLISVLRWPVLLVVAATAISVLYHFGPSRQRTGWRWQAPGAIVATVVWLAASFGFSWYLENFADYNATYGSLGAVIGFLMWVWISTIILLVGAELNASMEQEAGIGRR